MLTDDERKTINHAADVLGPSLRDLATRLRAIAAPRVATVGERPRPQCPTHGDTVNCYCTAIARAISDATAAPATVGGLLATEADALLCRWYAAKQAAIEALVDLENLRRPDPDDSWAGGIGRHDPMPGAEKRAADTKERLVAITDKVIAAMTRGPIGEG